MSDNTLISRVKKLTLEQLDAELASHEHNEIGRQVILQEKARRAIIEAARPNWIMRASLVLALVFPHCQRFGVGFKVVLRQLRQSHQITDHDQPTTVSRRYRIISDRTLRLNTPSQKRRLRMIQPSPTEKFMVGFSRRVGISNHPAKAIFQWLCKFLPVEIRLFSKVRYPAH